MGSTPRPGCNGRTPRAAWIWRGSRGRAASPPPKRCQTEEELDALAGKLYGAAGPLVAVVKVSPDATKIELAPRDGTSLRGRFREALLGPDPRP